MKIAGHDGVAPMPLRELSLTPLRYIDWIWRIRGSLPLAPGQSGAEVFDKLGPLFQEKGTSYERSGHTLLFRKKDQAAQDKMSIYDSGALHVEQSGAESRLRYDLFSRALLFCFLAPFLFLAFSQAIIALGEYEMANKPAETSEKKDKEKAERPMHPIDKFLGAPEPEKKDKKKEEEEAKEEERKKYSPTPAYVFAGIFSVLYVAGRILEAFLIRREFKKRLSNA